MITGKPFPLGVICHIYWPWCALCKLVVPSRLWLQCVIYGLWTSRYEADRRKVPICSFTSSWLCCTKASFVVWRAMHYGIVHLYSEHASTQKNPTHFLDRKLRQYISTPLSLVCDLKWSPHCSVVCGCVFVCMLACVQHMHRMQTYAGRVVLAEWRF